MIGKLIIVGIIVLLVVGGATVFFNEDKQKNLEKVYQHGETECLPKQKNGHQLKKLENPVVYHG